MGGPIGYSGGSRTDVTPDAGSRMSTASGAMARSLRASTHQRPAVMVSSASSIWTVGSSVAKTAM